MELPTGGIAGGSTKCLEQSGFPRF